MHGRPKDEVAAHKAALLTDIDSKSKLVLISIVHNTTSEDLQFESDELARALNLQSLHAQLTKLVKAGFIAPLSPGAWHDLKAWRPCWEHAGFPDYAEDGEPLSDSPPVPARAR